MISLAVGEAKSSKLDAADDLDEMTSSNLRPSLTSIWPPEVTFDVMEAMLTEVEVIFLVWVSFFEVMLISRLWPPLRSRSNPVAAMTFEVTSWPEMCDKVCGLHGSFEESVEVVSDKVAFSTFCQKYRKK